MHVFPGIIPFTSFGQGNSSEMGKTAEACPISISHLQLLSLSLILLSYSLSTPCLRPFNSWKKICLYSGPYSMKTLRWDLFSPSFPTTPCNSFCRNWYNWVFTLQSEMSLCTDWKRRLIEECVSLQQEPSTTEVIYNGVFRQWKYV